MPRLDAVPERSNMRDKINMIFKYPARHPSAGRAMECICRLYVDFASANTAVGAWSNC